MNIFWKILYAIFFVILAIVLLKFFLIILVAALLCLWFRTWQMGRGAENAAFVNGKLPNPKPDGLYRGSVGFKTAWFGKKFNSQDSKGINVFEDETNASGGVPSGSGKGGQSEKYPFITFVGKGLFNPNTFVLKIQYNIKENPWWARYILDEIVEIAPGEYLGKMHLNVIPGFPFSLLYFHLRRVQ